VREEVDQGQDEGWQVVALAFAPQQLVERGPPRLPTHLQQFVLGPALQKALGS
jgi:hypothetical protein